MFLKAVDEIPNGFDGPNTELIKGLDGNSSMYETSNFQHIPTRQIVPTVEPQLFFSSQENAFFGSKYIIVHKL